MEGVPVTEATPSLCPSHLWHNRHTRNKNDTTPRSTQVPPLSDMFVKPCLDDFMQNYFQKKPCLVELKLPPGMEKGAEWRRVVAELGERASLKNKQLVSVDADDPEKQDKHSNKLLKQALEQGVATKDVASALAQLAIKQMVAVRDPHLLDEDIALCRNSFSVCFGCPVTSNVYMNHHGATGFVEHHDTHEVFAMQLFGMKRWSIGEPILQNPSLRYRWRDSHVSPSSSMTSFDTKEGYLMYIPLGWRHKAEPMPYVVGPTSGPSIHVTMGLQTPRWVDLIEAVAHSAGMGSSPLRAPIPFKVSSGGVLQYSVASGALATMLQTLLTQAGDMVIPGGALVTVDGLDSVERKDEILGNVDDQASAAANGDRSVDCSIPSAGGDGSRHPTVTKQSKTRRRRKKK